MALRRARTHPRAHPSPTNYNSITAPPLTVLQYVEEARAQEREVREKLTLVEQKIAQVSRAWRDWLA